MMHSHWTDTCLHDSLHFVDSIVPTLVYL
jgi:hypothetical protein